MANVHYSSLAAKDLWENAEFIGRDKPDAAYSWVDSIENTCKLLSHNPEMGERRTMGRFGHCRCISVGNYVVFFRGVVDGVEIIRIVRGERDLDRIT